MQDRQRRKSKKFEKETYCWKGVWTTEWFHTARCRDFNFLSKGGKAANQFFQILHRKIFGNPSN
jgi:hypothetical protein